jgi:PHP family Zn ribbon phosphoesterase
MSWVLKTDMIASVDLHIHSCLSPCASDEMTPWNIVGMAMLKGLDAVAVCDHNSALNLPAAIKAGKEYGVCVVPGIEVTSREDVHLLCYFEALEQALELSEVLDTKQPNIKNKPSLFGEQIIVNEDDEPVGNFERLLLTACDLSLEDIYTITNEIGGIMVPAHVNKGANSLMIVLGMMPQDLDIPTVEIFGIRPHSMLGRLCLTSSDAHQLPDILEKGYQLKVDEISTKGIIAALRRGEKAGTATKGQ